MYKVLKNKKIIGISEEQPKLYDEYEVVEDTQHHCSDYKEYKGEYLLRPEIPAPTKEEQREKRALAYTKEVDPITAHIQRLRDEEQTPEIESEIQALIEERALKVEEIKQRYPYPEGENE